MQHTLLVPSLVVCTCMNVMGNRTKHHLLLLVAETKLWLSQQMRICTYCISNSLDMLPVHTQHNTAHSCKPHDVVHLSFVYNSLLCAQSRVVGTASMSVRSCSKTVLVTQWHQPNHSLTFYKMVVRLCETTPPQLGLSHSACP